ncbi:hypothetical protein CMI37_16520 [Candidatus Pacearchaeota archaeon]|nr:hypothetical protein [Candidatus Pacearchaeota archaeon]|tara:strand:- start:47 stop:493 length:447 start_codon:yes stop_codon:yes gene_type:complete
MAWKPEIPSLNDINIALVRLRREGACLNPKSVNPLSEDRAYAPPRVCVTHQARVCRADGSFGSWHEAVAMEFPWDHTEWSIYEAIEVARRGEGRVYIEQDVVELGWGPEKDPRVPDWTRWVDQGFSVEVWPEFTGKDKNSGCHWKTSS